MTDIEFKFVDAFTFATAMGQAPNIVKSEMTRATLTLVIEGERAAKEIMTANGSVVTGHGRRSITHRVSEFAGGSVVGKYGTTTPYLKLVENGRGPVVARGKALRFTIGGQVLYRKRVGPAAPRPFIRPSVDRIRPLVLPTYQQAMRRAVALIRGAS